jgi:hypothetical protein
MTLRLVVMPLGMMGAVALLTFVLVMGFVVMGSRSLLLLTGCVGSLLSHRHQGDQHHYADDDKTTSVNEIHLRDYPSKRAQPLSE